MFFKRIFTPTLAINSYLIGDEDTKQCVVIDPVRQVTPYIIQAQNAGLEITDIVETHVHADFVSGSKELKHLLNDKPCIHVSGMGGKKWIPTYADHIVYSKMQIKIGRICLEALHTPGHTPEHMAWICYDCSRSQTIPWFIFTGDTLFVGGVGRPDLLGTDEALVLAKQLYHTLFDQFAALPDFVEILPGHGTGSLCGKILKSRSSSTLGYERLFNSYLKKESEERWIKNLLKEFSIFPSYFQRVKKMNVEGPALLSSLKSNSWDKETSLPDLHTLFLVDVRHPEIFASSHLQGALNIPLASFAHWAGWMLPAQKPIGLILETNQLFSEIVDLLRLMGFDQEIWIIPLDPQNLTISHPMSSFEMLEVEELAKTQSQEFPIYILDVRTPEEWISGHILGSHHYELIYLEQRLKDLPKEEPIAVLCRSGQRASLASSLLEKYGFKTIFNIRGGIEAWKQAGLQLVTNK